MQNLKNTDDKTLVATLLTMAVAERTSQVEILRYLSEIDERRLVLDLGYSGMWDFCRRALKFSESTSTRRINVARAGRQYPKLLTMLEDGRLTLCTAADLLPLLNSENAEQLMAHAAGKSRREVQSLGVSLHAKPIERDVIRRIPVKAVAETSPLGFFEGTVAVAKTAPVVPAKPAAQTRIRVSFTAEEEVVRKLEKLQELLGGVTLAEVCDRAAEVLLEQVDPVRRARRRQQKKAKPLMPRKTPKPKTEPRRPRLAVADEVKVESGMRCSYTSPVGVRCIETRFLTIDHIQPYALGGKSTKSNSRCYCKAHNLHAGRQSFGQRSP